jgi:hypothetical protein
MIYKLLDDVDRASEDLAELLRALCDCTAASSSPAEVMSA